MSQINCIRLFTLLVAGAGLISCAKDGGHGESPAARANPAGASTNARVLHKVLIGGGGRPFIDTAAWGQQDRAMPLTGSIDVSEAAPKVAEVDVVCSNGDHPQIVRHSQFKNPRTIPMITVLPPELLVRDLEKQPVSCNFNVQLSDDGKIRYDNFFLADFNRDAGSLQIGKFDLDDPHRPSFRVGKMQGQRMTSQLRKPIAKLLCADADFPAVVVDKTLDLNLFQVEHPVMHDDVPPENLQQPNQLCRVATFERDHDEPREFTKLFELDFNKASLRVTMRPLSNRHVGRIVLNNDIPFAEYTVTNLEDHDQSVRMNSRKYNADLIVNSNPDVERLRSTSVDWIEVYREFSDVTRPLGDAEEFVVPAHSSTKFHLRFFSHGHLMCPHSRVRLTINDRLQLLPVGRDHQLDAPPVDLPRVRGHEIAVANPNFAFDAVKGVVADDGACFFR